MTFLTILGVTEILCRFRLVLEGKTGKDVPKSSRFELFEKFLTQNFALSDVEHNISGPLNTEGIADLPLLRTLLTIHQKSQEPGFWEVIHSFVLLAHASLAALRTLLMITSLPEFYLRFRTFILLVQTKKAISMNYGSSTRS